MNIPDLLSSMYSNIVPFVILLSILVFVHELGHFLVARMCGVRVEVFSIGFGKKILSYKKGDTVYCISLIPLGGYVKMFGEQNGDAIPESERSVSYTHKTVGQRIAIVLAGPLMNLFFAVVVFGGISYFGELTRSARIAEVKEGSVAEKAGLLANDKIISVDGVAVRSYEEFLNAISKKQNENAFLVVQQDGQAERTLSAPILSKNNPNVFSSTKHVGEIDGVLSYAKGSIVAIKMDSLAYRWGLRTGDEIAKIDGNKATTWSSLNILTDGNAHEVELASNKKVQVPAHTPVQNLAVLGIEEPDLYLGEVVPGSPAAKAEILAYDKILAINSEPISSWDSVLNTIKSYDGKEALTVTLLREGTEVVKKVTPAVTSQMTPQGKEDRRYTIGIVPIVNYTQPELTTVSEGSIFAAIAKGAKRSYDISAMTLISFVRMFQGEVSTKNIGGIISIGKAAKDSYEMGIQPYLVIMGVLSISLFILNLLPIPVLDGGHLVFYIIEAIKGSPLSMQKMQMAHQVGFVLLMGLMVLALFNDVTRFIFKS